MSDQDIYAGLSFESELRQVGVDGLRAHVAAETLKALSPQKHGEAVEVVRRFDASVEAAASAKREARAEETLSIAREANRIAESAASTASEALRTAKKERITAIVAAAAAIAAAIAAMYPLIMSYLSKS